MSNLPLTDLAVAKFLERCGLNVFPACATGDRVCAVCKGRAWWMVELPITAIPGDELADVVGDLAEQCVWCRWCLACVRGGLHGITKAAAIHARLRDA